MSASPLKYTQVKDVAGIVGNCRKAFRAKQLLPLEKRKALIHNIIKMIDEHTADMADAVNKDLRKPAFELEVMELAMVKGDCWEALSRLDKWAAKQPVEKELAMAFEDIYTKNDPLGVILIIGAWNYPFQLTLAPLVGAIAAGNTCVIKPSEVSPYSAQCLTDLIAKYFDPSEVTCINGAIPETTEVLAQKFDHILYTGNGRVARIVMAAAAKNLTPVTLELGGKSPCIVDDKVDIKVAARRIVWGRVPNAGQTCIAPDYILVKPAIKDQLVAEMKKTLKEWLGEDPSQAKDYTRMVNDFHFNRVKKLMDGGTIIHGGKTDADTKYIEPTIIDNVDFKHPLMTDEIFGPLLPIVSYNTVDEAINFVNDRDKPLALYIFSNDSAFVDKIINETSSGDVTVNDTLMHAGVPSLPFGGVGESGMGAYHGKLSYDIFSHKKGVMRRQLNMEFVNDMRYPPYTKAKLNRLKMLLMKNGLEKPWGTWFKMTAVVFAAVWLVKTYVF